MDHHLPNAQSDLKRRQNGNGHHATPIADLIPAAMTAVPYMPTESPPPPRAYELKPLDAFTFDHLPNQEHKARLKLALDKARTWLTQAADQPGLSFVLCGAVGTGKTTIAENLIQPFQRTVGAVADVGDMTYLNCLRDMYQDTDSPERRAFLAQEIADYERMLAPRQVSGGVLFESTALMRLVADQMPLSLSLARYDVIIIDDAGDEDFSTPTYMPSANDVQPIRQHRYGRLLDYCYRDRKRVIITSNVPLNNGEGVNPAFIDIFGSKAFDRLYQMSRGYMVDMTGLPSYRPYVVGGA